jgi:Glycosyl transferase family 2
MLRQQPDSDDPLIAIPAASSWLSLDHVAGRISIIVPTYNRAALVIELLENLAQQTWPDCEIIIVDDGSTDDTQSRVRGWCAAYPDRRMHVLSQANAGPAAARNRGIIAASGEYIHFIDSDDLLYPHALTAMVAAIQSSGKLYCLASTGISGIDGIADPANHNGRPRQPPDNLLASGWMTHGALYHRSAVAAAGPYAENLGIGEDTEFHWRIAATNGSGELIDVSVGVRREHGFGHLSIGRSPQEVGQASIAVSRAFLNWAQQRGQLSANTGNCVARACLVAGVVLGHVGDPAGKDAAFALARTAQPHRPQLHWLIGQLGRPDARGYYLIYRSMLWAARHGRTMVRKLHKAVQSRTLTAPPAISTT